ncbi:hypothetical protein [Asticcacaulis sp. 201]|uniref:hypothetical protein n=1 Tax=Asticcacaulis sp. 201 TaxID=3028787 RepID=UPI00291674EE|nr:hypothetical protein [Asticcacaulis sp. 201]MDV6331752.1 hypothetical protein [Asticcacaulis sp. 201]
MSANAPWSVKGIDAKAREVAKDLARRSGMTLGEWLNQMILQGEDVAALISRERSRVEAPVRAARRGPEPQIQYDEEDYEAEIAPRARRAPIYREVGYNELSGGRMARNEDRNDGRRTAAPFSSAAQPLSSRDLRRKSIFEDRPRFDDSHRAEEADYETASTDLNRVARALETLGSRIENSETRSATAVRGVSHAVESVLSRLERSEAAHAETKDRIEEQTQGVLSSFERIARAEEDQGAIARRLEQAERLIDAQAERLEGLSGHLREERDRVAGLEDRLKSPEASEPLRAVEGALGRLANQLYEGEARTRDTLKDVRGDMVGLSHRLAQVELRDPDRSAQILIDKVVAQLAHRLEAAEAQTTGAIKTLEQAFKSLDGRLNRVEDGGDVSDPETMRSLTGLAADLSRRVEESRQDLLNALQTGKQETIELAVKVVGERIEQSEKRSADAIERLGKDVVRIADTFNRRVSTVEATSRDGLSRLGGDVQRLSDSIDGRIGRSENQHAQALERLGGEIARISERLNTKLVDSERRTAQVLGAVSEQLEQNRDHVRSDLSERIRQSEARTAKLLEDTRARIDARLAKVQTESLLKEAEPRTARTVTPEPEPRVLPNPFENVAAAFAPEPKAAPVPEAAIDGFEEPAQDVYNAQFDAPEPDRGETSKNERFDLTGEVLGPVTRFANSDFKPDFDPFEEDDLEADLVSPEPAPLHVEKSQVHAVPPVIDEDDSDPFADIEVSRKTAPRSVSFAESHPAPSTSSQSPFDDDDDLPVGEAVSMSTRDALAAARAAVRASMEGDSLGTLKSGPSRSRGIKPDTSSKAAAKAGSTLSNTLKASSIAMGLVAVGATGLVVANKLSDDKKAPPPIVASALTVGTPASDTANLANLKTRYDLADQALRAKDPKAIDALKMVANQGYAPAQYRLGQIYKGDEKIVPIDLSEARAWFKRAAEGGVPNAMFMLGAMYFEGDGGVQDRPTAAMWFREAAKRGVVDSQFNLASLYQSGDGVALNLSEAYKWMRIAANNGDKDAPKYVDDLAAKLSESERTRADIAVANFTPITDGAPLLAAPAGSEGR